MSISKIVTQRKWNNSRWGQSELPPDENTKQVLNMLHIYFLDNTNFVDNVKINIINCSDYYFKNIRNNDKFLKEFKVFKFKKIEQENTNDKKKKKIQISKKDQIRQGITDSKFKDIFDKFEPSKLLVPKHTHAYIELVIYDIMFHVKYMLEKHKVACEEIYEMIFGINRFLNYIKTAKTRNHTTGRFEQVNQYLINDIEKMMEIVQEKFPIDILKISNDYPKLFYLTKYDNLVPGLGFKPYESQINLMSIIKENKDNNWLIILNSLMAMGKTTSVPIVAQVVKKYDSSKTVVFCCPESLDPIRLDICRYCHFLNIPYANVIYDSKNKLVVKPNNLCKKYESRPLLYITSIKSATDLLKNGYKDDKKPYLNLVKSNVVLFFDENTINMDKEYSEMVYYISDLFEHLPPKVILSSATNPNIENMPKLREYFLSKYNNSKFFNVNNTDVKIGTLTYNLNTNEIWIPHSKCNSISELSNIVNKLEQNIIYAKHYTIKLVNNVYNQLVKYNINVPEEYKFSVYMDKLENRNQLSIQKLGIQYLKYIIENNDEDIIKKLCSEKFNNTDFNFDKFLLYGVKSYVPDYGNYTNNIKGLSFVSVDYPDSFFMRKYRDIFENIYKELKINSFNDINKTFMQNKEKIDKMMNKKSKNSNDSELVGMSKLEREQFNDSSEYFTSSSIVPTIPNITTIPYNIVDWDSIDCQDQLKFALWLGYGIYDPYNMSVSYTEKVIDLASQNKLKIIFANEALNYGISFPFNNGFILDDMSLHSAKSICQLFARAGRPGKSDTAIIYADSDVINKVEEELYNLESYIDIELVNINKAIDIITSNNVRVSEPIICEEITNIIELANESSSDDEYEYNPSNTM